jgi:hypothetical protein
LIPDTTKLTSKSAVLLGALLSAPSGQMLIEGFGWRVGAARFVVLSAAHAAGCLVRRQG